MVITPANAQVLLKTGVQDFEARNGHAFGMCGNMKALCGCVYAEGDSNDDFNEVKITGNAAVESVLKEIIRKNPRYQWTIEDGVINIAPKKEFRHLVNGKDPLDTIVEDFTINEERGLARNRVCNAAGLNCLPRDLAGIRELCKPISLHLKKVTLREALNKIVKADGMASWEFEYYGEDKQPFVDIHCWRPGGGTLIEEDTATLKLIMEEAARQPIENKTSPYWYKVLLFAIGLLIFYFVIRAFRAKIKPGGRGRCTSAPSKCIRSYR
ncbi:MAG: hypothetical protein HY796_04520 [Elusimicrobia bacterium]|nr:hypothetical protein [Elusimicrobiota bacterium]